MKTKKKAFGVSTVYIVIFLLLEISIVIGGFRHYKNFERDFNVNVENQFRLIADLKVREIEHWLFERKSDAAILFDNEVFAALVKKHFENPEDTKIKGEIRVWMEKLQDNANNEAVMLLDPQLVKKIVIPESAERASTFISPGKIDSLNQDKLVFEDFFRDEFNQKIFLKILIPVLDARQLIGIVEIRIDPQHYFYPTLQNWPMTGETSEALIFRREGKDAVCVCELKFQKDAALNLRVSLEQKNLIAVQTVLGQSGPAKGIGYRGNAVIAHVDKVPNSPWYLVAQTDESEVNIPLREKYIDTVILFFSLFLLAGIGMVMVWRYQQSQLSKERIKSEKALFELNLAIQNSRDVVFLTDIHGTITYINPEFTKTYGYPAEEVVGKVTPRILNSGMNQKEDFRSFWNALLNKQTVHKTEYFNRCKDGQLVEIESTANSVINQQGDIIGFLGIQRDITLRKRSELEQSVIYEIIQSLTVTDKLSELLKVIHQSLAKVLYAENIFVALQNQDTGLFSFPYWVDQFDTVPEPVALLKSCSSFVFNSGKPVLFSPELFQQLKEQNEVELVGSPSPSWIGVPLKTRDKTNGVLVLQHYEKENVYSEHDINFLNAAGSQIAIAIERKLAEEALRESENELNVVLQSTADGILAIDGEGKVIKSNKRFTDLFSIPPSLMNSKDSYALVDYILEQLINPDEVILKEKKLYHSTENDLDILYFRDGRIFERFSEPLINDDSSVGRVWSFRDITERKKAEEEIKVKNSELSKAISEKDKFFSIISHDLRGPFNGFLGLTRIMSNELADLTFEELQKMSSSLEKSASQLFRLLENLLNWARIQQGLIPFNPVMVKLLPSVDECIALMQEQANAKEIEIVRIIPEELTVFADDNMLQTIIRNLVFNSVKFTRKGGRVTISVKTSDPTHVEIVIRDTGIGMSQSIIDQLFRLDVQSSRRGTDGEASSGLGLLLCKEFVEKHGGRIWTESEVGNGSIFHFTIPVNRPDSMSMGSYSDTPVVS